MINSFPHLFDNFYKEVQEVQPKLFEIIRGYHILIVYFSTCISVFGPKEISEISLKQPEIMGMTKASSFSKMSVLTKDFMIDFMVALELERSL